MFDEPYKEMNDPMGRLDSEMDSDWLDRELAEVHKILGDREPETAPVRDLDDTQVFRNSGTVRNYANGYGQGVNYNGQYDYHDGYPDEDEEEAPEKSNRGLVILALVETLGILGIVIYWAVRLL